MGNAFVEHVLTSASEVEVDANHRWTLPVELSAAACLGGENRGVVILPGESGLEIWDRKRKLHVVKAALENAPMTNQVSPSANSLQGKRLPPGDESLMRD